MIAQSLSTRYALLALVAAVQIGLVGKIVFDRVSLLRNGREIALPIVPVDPRDLFRGDYVTLGYPMSQIKIADLPAGASFKELAAGRTAYVTLHQGADQAWAPVAVAPAYPAAAADADVVVRGVVTNLWNTQESGGDRIFLRYGLERYFVPEGTGRELEEKVRDKTMQAIVAVGADGEAAIKGLLIGGERREDAPLF